MAASNPTWIGRLKSALGNNPPRWAWLNAALGLVGLDLLGSILIVRKVPYTEIDWIAYMQEVSGYLQGERDYLKLRGDTGPLVYPAGFVYVYSWLYHLTHQGKDILMAQYMFVGLYILNLALVMGLYRQARVVPVWAWPLLCASKRVHSLFMLRMFNDTVAMALLYAAVAFFARRKWGMGCTLYSLAVSVKMNIFLFAPGLFLLLLQALGPWKTFLHIGWCGVIQLVLGWPFLTTYPSSYLSRSFELGRVFMYKWTVNWKFLDEQEFVSKTLSLTLLALTAITMSAFAVKWVKATQSSLTSLPSSSSGRLLSPRYIITTLFVSNFIGIAFSRTLHYQFYSWYFHTLPLLLWHCTDLPVPLKLTLLAGIEYAFNVYPATPKSSTILQVCHVILLQGLWHAPVPSLQDTTPTKKANKKRT